MNRIYRLVYNVVLGQVQVASELAGASTGGTTGRRLACPRTHVGLALAVGLALSGPDLAHAIDLPTGFSLRSGNATHTAGSMTLAVNQTSPKAFIDWSSFTIGAGGTVAFTVPSAQSVTLNYVQSGISQIDGALFSNGQVFLINPNGIVFGGTSRVIVGGLVAAAAGYTPPTDFNADFKPGVGLGAGTDTFHFDLSSGSAGNLQVVNGAVLTAGGPILLLGNSITQSGELQGQSVHLMGKTVEQTASGEMFMSEAITIGGADGVDVVYRESDAGSSLPFSVGTVSGSPTGQAAVTTNGRLNGSGIQVSSASLNLGGIIEAVGLVDLTVDGGAGIDLSATIHSGGVRLATAGDITQNAGGLSTYELRLGTASDASGQPRGPGNVRLGSDSNLISRIQGNTSGDFELKNLQDLTITGMAIGGNASLTASAAQLDLNNLTVGGTLSATGGYGLNANTVSTTRGDIVLDTGIGQLALHNVTAGNNLTATGGTIIQTGTLSAAGLADLRSTSGMHLQNVTAGRLLATAGGGLGVNAARVTGGASLTSEGPMTLIGVTAGNLSATGLGLTANTVGTTTGTATLDAGLGLLALQDVIGASDLVAKGGRITQTGTLRVTGQAEMDSEGDLQMQGLTSGTLLATAEGTMGITGATVSGQALLTSSGSMTLGQFESGTLNASGSTVNATTVGASQGNATVVARTGALSWEGGTVAGNLSATGVGLTARNVSTTTGNATLDAGSGGLTLQDVAAGNNLTAKGRTITQIGVLRSVRHMTAQTPSALALQNVTAGSLAIDGVPGLTLTNAAVGSGATLRSSGAMTLTGVTAGNLSATGLGLIANDVETKTGAASLDAGTGLLALHDVVGASDFVGTGGTITQTGTLRVTGQTDMGSTGNLQLQGVTTGTMLATVGGTMGIIGATVTGEARLTSTGGMTLGQFQSGSLNAKGSTLTATTVGTSQGDATLVARTGALSWEGGAVAGNLSATGVGLTARNVGTTTGNATLDAGSGGLTLQDVAAGNNLTAKGGTITQTGFLRSVRHMTAQTPSALALQNLTAGSLTIDGVPGLTLTNATVDSGATLRSSGVMTLTGVTAGTLSATGLGLTANAVETTTGAATLDAGTGLLALQNVAAASDLSATGSTITHTGTLSVAGLADLRSTADMQLQNVSAGELVAMAGGGLGVTGATITGGASLTSNGAMALTDVTAGNLSATGLGLTASAVETTTGDATLDAGTGLLALQNVVGASNFTATGGTITQTGTLSVTGLADLGSAGNLQMQGVTTGSLLATAVGTMGITGATVAGNARLTSTGGMTLGQMQAGGMHASGSTLSATTVGTTTGNATLDAGTGGLTLHDVTAGNNLVATGSTITPTGTLSVAGLADLRSTADMQLRNVSAGELVAMAGGGLGVNGATITGGASLTSNGAMTLGGLSARTLTATGKGLSASTLSVAGNAALDAGNQAMVLSGVSTIGGNLQTDSQGVTQSGSLGVTGAAILAAGQGSMSLQDVWVGGDLSATALGIRQTGSLAADGHMVLEAGTGELVLAGVRAGNGLVASAGTITQSDGLDVTGAAVLTATDTLALQAVAATTLQATAGRDLSIDGAHVTGVGTLAAGGTLTLDTVSFGTLDARGAALHATGLSTSGDAHLLASVGNAQPQAVGGALTLGGLQIGGDLTASGQSISQSGNGLVVQGDAEFVAGGDIALNRAGNRFMGDVVLSGQQVALAANGPLAVSQVRANRLELSSDGLLRVDEAIIAGDTALAGDGVDLGRIGIGGGLIVASTAGIGQHGAMHIAGNGRFTAAGDVLLDQAGNDFVGDVGVQAASIRLVDANALTVSGLDNRGGAGAVDVSGGGRLSVAGTGVAAGTAALSLQSRGADIQVAQALSAGDIELAAAAGVGLAANVTGTNRITLASAGNVMQTAGALTTGHLEGQVDGRLRLQQANRIQTLGNLGADSLALVNAAPLLVAGDVLVSDALSLQTQSGDLTLQGHLSGTDVRLQAADDIRQQAGSGITADRLSGQAGGRAELGTASDFIDNRVATLGDFIAHGGFSLTNGQTVYLEGLNSRPFSVDAGSSAFYLQTVGGDIHQRGIAPVMAGDAHFRSSAAIGLQSQPIQLVSVTGNLVAELPAHGKAYINAITPNGEPIAVSGAINLPLIAQLSREQMAVIARLPEMDRIQADGENGPVSMVQPGLRLPVDRQQVCDGADPDADCIQ